MRRRIALCGAGQLKRDLGNFTAALAGVEVTGAFLPANTPETIEHWMANEYYKDDEAFPFAIAEAMRDEYKAIVDAGFLVQIDDPDLPDGWACLPDITVPEYRKYAAMRIDALNHALHDIPREQVSRSVGRKSPARRGRRAAPGGQKASEIVLKPTSHCASLRWPNLDRPRVLPCLTATIKPTSTLRAPSFPRCS